MKKIFALLLSVLMIFTVLPVSFAAEKVTPVIVVSGMNSYPLVDAETGEQAYGPTGEKITNLVVKNIPALTSFLVSKDWQALADEVAGDVYTDIFEIISCDKEGDSKYSITTKTFPKSLDNYPDEWNTEERLADEEAVIAAMMYTVGAENTYFFNYDWRLDPMEHADDLNDFIENVKKEKNCDRVTLIPCSMGGVITNSYLAKYGSLSCEKIIYAMTAFQGLDMVGELFCKRIDIDTDMLTEYLFSFQRDNLDMQIVFALVKTLTEMLPEMSKVIDDFMAESLFELNDRVYNEVIADSLGGCPGFWSFVPEEYYEEAKSAMLGENVNEVFEKRIDAYHYGVQVKAKEIMDIAQKNGTAIVLLSSYGYVGAPCASSVYTQGDCLIEAYREAGGATTAKWGETLGDETYTAIGTVCGDKAHNHVSTDCIVDASTGMYPEYTWYIKYNKHVGLDYYTDCTEFLKWMVTSDGQVTVHDNGTYPQFMSFNNVTGELTSLTGSKIKIDKLDEKTTVLSRFVIIIKTLYWNIINCFKEMGESK